MLERIVWRNWVNSQARFKYPLLVDLVDISFSSASTVAAFGAEGTGFDPRSWSYNDGSDRDLNLKCSSLIHAVVNFSRPCIHVLVIAIELAGRRWNEGMLIDLSFRYYEIRVITKLPNSEQSNKGKDWINFLSVSWSSGDFL